MEHTKQSWNTILWIEAFGFSLLIALSWLTELIRIPHLLYGEEFVTNWHRAILRTIVVSFVWAWVHLGTKRVLKRLHYLEGFLRICSWCRKVGHDEEWLTMEDYFASKFATPTSHGMCPGCVRKNAEELRESPGQKSGAG